MAADISLSIEREPDFFALCRARGSFRAIVAENENEIVGCASVARHQAYVRRRPTEIGYVGDVKVAPEFRRQGLARHLVEAVMEGEHDLPPAPYIALTAAGNAAVEGLMRSCGTMRAVRHLGDFTSYQLFPLVRLPQDGRIAIRPAESQDQPELAGLLDGFHRNYTFAPVFSGEGFADVLARSPGMDVSCYWIARRAGHMVAALGLWDQHSFKRTRVHKMPAVFRWAGRLVRAASRALPLPHVPAEGELLAFRYVRHAAHVADERGALTTLIAHAVNTVRQRGEHFVLFTCDSRDPLGALVRGIPRTRYRYSLVAGTNVAGYEKEIETLAGEPLYDDAALA